MAGTSIGAINAAIIAGSKSGDSAADPENFWLAKTVAPSSLPDSLKSSLHLHIRHFSESQKYLLRFGLVIIIIIIISFDVVVVFILE